MAIRTNLVEEAARRARQQLTTVISELCAARRTAGLSQAVVGAACGWSRQLVGAMESGRIEPTPTQLARWGAVVGLDIPIRTYPGGSPLRDAGQLRLLARFQQAVGSAWTWRTEVPVSSDRLDRRAIDCVAVRRPYRVGIEAIARLADSQAQVRSATLKQQAADLDLMLLVLADTRHNRRAIEIAAPSLTPAFPLTGREVLAPLRAGRLPAANGVVLI